MTEKAKTKKTTKKAKAPTKAKANKAKMLVVIKRIREHVNEKGDCRVSAEFYEAFSKAVQDLCNKAMDNAKECGRKTLQAKDV